MKNIYKLALTLMITVSVISCKYVDIPLPQNELPSDLTFSDDKAANAAVVGIYSRMNAYNYQFTNAMGGMLMGGMLADDIYYALSTTAFNQMRTNSLVPDHSYVRTMWDEPYGYIYQANAIIEGLESSSGVSASAKNQYLGEARFVRAFCYFYLVNYFGRVPLITNTDVLTNTVKPRTSIDSVYNQIISDLVSAQELLGDDYPTAERTRPNKAVATALLARVYLYRERWADAEDEADKIISDPRYQLIPLNQIFLKNSNETIWQLQTVNTSTAGVNTWEGFNVVPVSAGSRSYYNAYESFVNAIEPGDQRLTSYLNTYELNGQTYYFPYKYKVRTASPVVEYTMVLRTAEQYLIRAEARARQNNLDGARSDLDSIRLRAGLSPLPDNLNQAQLLLAVEQERRVELFAEWGHRWLDLKRTGRALTVLSAEKPDIDENDLLLPIPASSINANVFLEPNPGYDY
ncbi:MAG TPA: RagB/SusD family nutrient uptake outer membrane protein [Parasegetibacter sp.]